MSCVTLGSFYSNRSNELRIANLVMEQERELTEMQPVDMEEVETVETASVPSVPENASEVIDNQSVTTSNFGETMEVLKLSSVEVTVLRKSFDLLLESLGWDASGECW